MPEIKNVAGQPYDGPVETGRMFIYDSSICGLVAVAPDHDDWHYWTEMKDADGDLYYVSDHEGYTLDAEEFGDTDILATMAHNYATNQDVPIDEAIEKASYGRWYIKMNYAGYNSQANNLDGYSTAAAARAAILRYQGRSK